MKATFAALDARSDFEPRRGGAVDLSAYVHRRGGVMDDLDFICERLTAGVPVAHVARQCSRPEASVQRIADTLNDYAGEIKAAPPRLSSEAKSRSDRFGPLRRWSHPSIYVSDHGAFSVRMVISTSYQRAPGARGRLGYALSDPRTRPTMRSILAEVAKRHGLSEAELLGSRVQRDVAHPRQEAMWLMREQHRWSLPQIGQFLGGRDHTTVLYGVRKHEERLIEAGLLVRAAP